MRKRRNKFSFSPLLWVTRLLLWVRIYNIHIILFVSDFIFCRISIISELLLPGTWFVLFWLTDFQNNFNREQNAIRTFELFVACITVDYAFTNVRKRAGNIPSELTRRISYHSSYYRIYFTALKPAWDPYVPGTMQFNPVKKFNWFMFKDSFTIIK